MSLSNPVIAIDGYSSCGKSTVARALSSRLNLRYIDSGAMYRAVTWYFICNNLPFQAEQFQPGEMEAVLDNIHLDFILGQNGISEIYLNGQNVENEIRSMEVSSKVSLVSAIPLVRHRMVALQQKMRKNGSIVMDGRDIGTTVFPDADLKIFMTADPKVRAERRFKELTDKGIKVTEQEILDNLSRRDFEDQNRKESPLRKADDAIVLDNTNLNFTEQLDFVVSELEKQILKHSE